MATTVAADKPAHFPIRNRTGTAHFHLSKEAVDFGIDELERMTKREVVLFVAELRWGSAREMSCSHCGTFDEHYFRPVELRWKCKGCDKTFSVTSGTVFADRKLPLVKILKVAYNWANGASGVPALQLRRYWNVSYETVYTLAQKLREGLLRGFNTGILCGVQEMDGMDVNGRRYKEKRNKPLGGKTAGKPKIPAHLLKPEPGEELVGPPLPPKFEKTAKQPADRRLLIVIRQRSVSSGKGAVATRIAVARTESAATVTAVAQRFASAESTIMSDEDPAYGAFSRLFAKHKTINHSKAYALPDGTNNNQAESFNWRMRRGVEGIYLSASNKYLKDYAAEQAWREDTRKLSTGKKLRHLLHMALSVGMSLWWRNYGDGRHRKEELLVEGAVPAKGRGKRPGAKPRPPR